MKSMVSSTKLTRSSPNTRVPRTASVTRLMRYSAARPRCPVLAAIKPDSEQIQTTTKPSAPDVVPSKIHTAPKPSTYPPLPLHQEEPFMDIIMDKVWYTAEDVLTILKRTVNGVTPQEAGDDRLMRDGNGKLVYESDRPVILVLGSGWASHAFVKIIDINKFDVIVVSPRNHFVFTPMLPSTAVGGIEFRSVLEPVRVANEYVSFFEASADNIDLKNKVATCRSLEKVQDGEQWEFSVKYDRLFVGIGEVPATFGTPGVQDYCYFIKEVRDCIGLRKQVQLQFERAAFLSDPADEQARTDALRFVIVGGGPTGVEFAGTLSDFISSDLVKRYPTLVKQTEVVLVQSGSSILPVFDLKLAQQALENLEKLNVTVKTGVRVKEVTSSLVKLDSGEELGYGCCVWSTGNASRPLVQDLVAQLPEQQQFASKRAEAAKLAVDPFCRIVGAPDAFAVGDCSRMVLNPLPTTAQVAGQQGAYAARLVNKSAVVGLGTLDGKAPYRWTDSNYPVLGSEIDKKQFNFLSLGIMAYIGDDRAIVNVEAGGTSFDVAGRVAFLLWRSVYITKQVSTRNRFLILFDWVKTRVFGRDISLF